MKGKTRGPERSFTMIELLVVVSVIAVLAAMLLPALAAAREKAHRAECNSNLGQTGIALTYYLANHDGYFPGDVLWRAEVSTDRSKVETGVYVAPDGNWTYAAIGKTAHFNPPEKGWEIPYYAQTNIGIRNWSGPEYQVRNPYDAGKPSQDNRMRMAPVGLGFLVTTDYLPECTVLFCPSAKGTGHRVIDWRGESISFGQDMRRAGGYDKRALLYGERELSLAWRPQRCDYQYRGYPSAIEQSDSDPRLGPGRARIRFTRPRVTAFANCPPFKTSRLLGLRAIVSDSFSKGWRAKDTEPGDGQHSHKDGYYVLYGDGHTWWYGDPQQQIIWWRQPKPGPGCQGFYTWVCLKTSGLVDNSTKNLTNKGSQYIWHRFDGLAGVDVGTDEVGDI